ncbi:uncharacterized protein LOC114531553 [Dendronephthya gigantea]|uniref:uncharacterized protein LOC114531553 n=1 Tax=Dendronephthya gigantea TaxID=151771 RepID=UPI001068ED1D|nr:uncharacterized protein LOC114531553 [Dendronephthya gigantea]
MDKTKSPQFRDLNARVKKTKLIAYGSCKKQKFVDQNELKDEASRQKNDSNETSESLKIKSAASNEVFEDDDVFLWNQIRRASEPVYLKRNDNEMISRTGRQNPSVLRSLSEGIPVPADRSPRAQPRLTRSASSSDAQTALSQLFAFSPRIVRKINLNTSLRDWLDNEKQSRNDAAKKIAAIPARSSYRRRSADMVGKKSNVDERRRPSAPPELSGRKDENDAHNSVQAKPHITPCYKTSCRFDSVQEFQIHSLIKEQLKSKLESVQFCTQSCRGWCEDIAETIKERIQVILNSPCKVVCLVYIGALRDYGIHTGSQATLDEKLDYHASACYQNDSLFATVSVLAGGDRGVEDHGSWVEDLKFPTQPDILPSHLSCPVGSEN